MSNTNELLSQGIAALKAGQKTKARKLLEQVVQLDKHNESAWLWLSGAVDTDKERRVCLQKVLAINPGSEAARLGLQHLGHESMTSSSIQSSIPGPRIQPPAPPKHKSHLEISNRAVGRGDTSKGRRWLILVSLVVCLMLCVVAAAIFRIPAAIPGLSTSDDRETAQCISRTFQAKYGETFDLFATIAMMANNGRNHRYVVRTEDPKKEVWVIESVYDMDVTTSGGKVTKTIVEEQLLFDITTTKLTVSRETAQALYSMGEDVSGWSLDLKQYCPNLKK